MNETPRPPPPPRPAAMGCLLLAGAIAVMVVVGGFLIVFLESGANTGEVELRNYESYAVGSVEFVGEHNFFVVRLGGRQFIALSDLDAANRAASGRRCRVAPIPTSDPELRGILERYAGRFDGAAEGTTLVFREDCNGALYNVLGERLDADARNLDRYPVSVDDAGRVVVDVSERRCSQGPVEAPRSEIECG